MYIVQQFYVLVLSLLETSFNKSSLFAGIFKVKQISFRKNDSVKFLILINKSDDKKIKIIFEQIDKLFKGAELYHKKDSHNHIFMILDLILGEDKYDSIVVLDFAEYAWSVSLKRNTKSMSKKRDSIVSSKVPKTKSKK